MFKLEWLNSINENINTSTLKADTIIYLKSILNTKFCMLTNSGTAALYLGILGLGLKPNDEIIIPAFSYPAVYEICKYLHLDIKFVDININTLCIDATEVKKVISKKTKAICFINHLGYVGPDIKEIANIAAENNVLFFEDSSQGMFQRYSGKHAGSYGRFGVLSFSDTKIVKTGEGGCIYTDNIVFNKRLENKITEFPLNFNMSKLSISLLKSQLVDSKNIVDSRIKIFNKYKDAGIDLYHNFSADEYTGLNMPILISSAEKLKKLNNLLTAQKIWSRLSFYKAYGKTKNAIKIESQYLELPLIDNDEQINNISNMIKIIKI